MTECRGTRAAWHGAGKTQCSQRQSRVKFSSSNKQIRVTRSEGTCFPRDFHPKCQTWQKQNEIQSRCQRRQRGTVRENEMGSTDKAVITGFICRLCSKMNRFVIHIYGEEGERMKLAEKINAYLPITVNMNDPLPKTACLHCIERLEAHHELMEQFMFARRRLAAENKANSVASSTTTTVVDAAIPAPTSPPC